jgi:hypothetical protein
LVFFAERGVVEITSKHLFLRFGRRVVVALDEDTEEIGPDY